ncbi:hypothetical protein Gotur_021006 [Gossypium turneri]
MRDSYMCLVCSWAANSILHSSAHWWKDEGSTHTFHLPYSECTITLEDVALQLSFPVDGSVATGLEVIPDKDDTCEEFLGKVLKKFYSDRIGMKWLETNFKYLPKDALDIVKEQYAQAFILKLIGGILMPDKSRNLAWWRLPILRLRVNDPYMFLLVTRSNHGQSCVGLLEQLEDIRLLLDQHSKDNFEWMSYVEPDITEYVSSKFLATRSMWDAKVPLIVMEFLPIREPFFSSDTTSCLDYMPWFRVVGKLYLLSVGAMSSILHPNTDVNVEPNVDVSTVTDGDIDTDIDTFIDLILMPKSMLMYPEDTQWETSITLYSSMEEGDGNKDKNEANDGDGDEDDGGDEDKHEGRGENKEDKDDSHYQVKELVPLLVRRNPTRTP